MSPHVSGNYFAWDIVHEALTDRNNPVEVFALNNGRQEVLSALVGKSGLYDVFLTGICIDGSCEISEVEVLWMHRENPKEHSSVSLFPDSLQILPGSQANLPEAIFVLHSLKQITTWGLDKTQNFAALVQSFLIHTE